MTTIKQDHAFRYIICAALPVVFFLASPILLLEVLALTGSGWRTALLVVVAELVAYLSGHVLTRSRLVSPKSFIVLLLGIAAVAGNAATPSIGNIFLLVLVRITSGLFFGILREYGFRQIMQSGTHERGFARLLVIADGIAIVCLGAIGLLGFLGLEDALFYCLALTSLFGLTLIRGIDDPRIAKSSKLIAKPQATTLLVAVVGLLSFHMAQGAIWTLMANTPVFTQRLSDHPALFLAGCLFVAMLGSLVVLRSQRSVLIVACFALIICPIAVWFAYSVVPFYQFVLAVAYIAFVWNVWSSVLMAAISRVSADGLISTATSYSIRVGSVLGPLAILPFVEDTPTKFDMVAYSTLLYIVSLGCIAWISKNHSRVHG